MVVGSWAVGKCGRGEMLKKVEILYTGSELIRANKLLIAEKLTKARKDEKNINWRETLQIFVQFSCTI